MKKTPKLAIGLVGRIGAGKGLVADYLKKKGFSYFSLSQIVREEASKRGYREEEFSRQLLQDIGDDLRKDFGNKILTKKVVEKIKKSNLQKVIVDSIRNFGEVSYLKKSFENFYLIGIDAPQKLRFKRLIERRRPSDPKNWSEFLKADSRDAGSKQGESGQQVNECLNKADFIIFNNFKKSQKFYLEIEKVLKTINESLKV